MRRIRLPGSFLWCPYISAVFLFLKNTVYFWLTDMSVHKRHPKHGCGHEITQHWQQAYICPCCGYIASVISLFHDVFLLAQSVCISLENSLSKPEDDTEVWPAWHHHVYVWPQKCRVQSVKEHWGGFFLWVYRKCVKLRKERPTTPVPFSISDQQLLSVSSLEFWVKRRTETNRHTHV